MWRAGWKGCGFLEMGRRGESGKSMLYLLRFTREQYLKREVPKVWK